MAPIWEIDSNAVKQLQGQGKVFVRRMNYILEVQANKGKLPGSALHLNLADDHPDGGVDAAVHQAVPPGADPEGLFTVPTCWQFKASPSGSIKPRRGRGRQEAALKEEIRKWYVQDLIKRGYGYRFCIADDLTSAQKTKWEGWLEEAAKEIYPDAEKPRVITADLLARWINRFPAVIRLFRPELASVSPLDQWKDQITELTKEYVPILPWNPATETIREFADFGTAARQVLLTVGGEAGVGKTRCVYEALAANPASRALVVYTTDERAAMDLANQVAANEQMTALIVADECGLQASVDIERRFRSNRDSLRVIAINNTRQDEPRPEGEIRLTRMSSEEVEKILARNFPALPPDRRWAFASLAQGFVRLAVDLCHHDHLIPPDGNVGPLIPFFRDHLHTRLLQDELAAVQLVSLLARVGYRDDVRGELEGLCNTCPGAGLTPQRVQQIAQRLKQAPGFIAIGERYLYVTPRLIAQVAFQSAWERWVGPDPERFFIDLPPELEDSFVRQLRDAGTDEMRRTFFRFFQNWTSRLRAEDLGDEATVLRLVRLAEVDPQALVPQVRRLVESAEVTLLRTLHAGRGRQGARRELVWFAEKFLRLPEHFADAERILLRLALAETESYSNNASGVWADIFRPFLSGTPIPFAERIRLLEQRFQNPDETQRALCVAALKGPLHADRPTRRLLGPPVVAGRIPPADWQPTTQEEARACWTLTLDLLKRLARSPDANLREAIVGLTIDEVVALLRQGFLEDVIDILGEDPLPDARLAELLRQLDWFLQLHGSGDSRTAPEELERSVRQWRDRLVPHSLHGRLVAVVGQEPWHLWEHEADRGETLLTALARDLLDDPNALERELPWLCSREARSAARLGMILGTLDGEGGQLDRILDVASGSDDPGLARGYLVGLGQDHPEHLDRISDRLDRLARTQPQAVYHLVSGGPAFLRPAERLLALVDAGRLAPELLRSVAYRPDDRPLPDHLLRGALDRLTEAARQGNGEAGRAAQFVLRTELRSPRRSPDPEVRSAPDLPDLLERVLTSLPEDEVPEPTVWVALLDEWSKSNPEAAIRHAVQAMASDNWNLADEAQRFLVSVAPSYPEAVMEALGAVFLDPAIGWRLGVRRLHDLIEAIPEGLILRWLDQHGRAGAVALARHLPPPYLDEAGSPVVPELTAQVLQRFGQDERVFEEFCAGVHSGKVYWGDSAGQYEREGMLARRFLGHELQPIHEWAQQEIERATRQASWSRAQDEELTAP